MTSCCICKLPTQYDGGGHWNVFHQHCFFGTKTLKPRPPRLSVPDERPAALAASPKPAEPYKRPTLTPPDRPAVRRPNAKLKLAQVKVIKNLLR